MDWTWYLFASRPHQPRQMWLAMVVCLLDDVLGGLTVAIQPVRRSGPFSSASRISSSWSIPTPISRHGRPPRLLIKLVGTTLLLWVYFATSIKRLHDRDKSGWWMVPFFACPASTISSRTGFRFHAACRWPRCIRLCLWGFIEMYCLKGSPGPTASAPTRWRRAIRGRLGPAERDRNGAAQGWPAAGLAC